VIHCMSMFMDSKAPQILANTPGCKSGLAERGL
jgi:hypothetical protein